MDGNYEKKTTKISLLLLKVPTDFDEITQGLQDSEAFIKGMRQKTLRPQHDSEVLGAIFF